MPMDNRLFLLDSFEGLPENWGNNPNQKKGAFKMKAVPVFSDNRAVVIRGLFKDTVPELTEELFMSKSKLTFIHIDCDLYNSTCDVLFNIRDYLSNPCYMLFDEFYNYPEYEDHEYKAFFEFIEDTGYNFEALFKTEGCQMGFKVWK
jgi:hypothetical protein